MNIRDEYVDKHFEETFSCRLSLLSRIEYSKAVAVNRGSSVVYSPVAFLCEIIELDFFYAYKVYLTKISDFQSFCDNIELN